MIKKIIVTGVMSWWVATSLYTPGQGLKTNWKTQGPFYSSQQCIAIRNQMAPQTPVVTSGVAIPSTPATSCWNDKSNQTVDN